MTVSLHAVSQNANKVTQARAVRELHANFLCLQQRFGPTVFRHLEWLRAELAIMPNHAVQTIVTAGGIQ